MEDQQDQQSFGDGLDDMADLFDDANSVMPPSMIAASPDVALRLNELSTLGCCQKIAWSNSGAITCISQDNLRLSILYLTRSPTQPAYSLSEPQRLDLPGRFKLPVLHCSWSLDGSNMVVFDSRGNLAVYYTAFAINRLHPKGLLVFDEIDSTGAIVGMLWLRPKKSYVVCFSADRDATTWKYNMANVKVTGPSHPMLTRNTFITVSRNGTVRLCWAPVLELVWGCASARLGACDSTGQLLTHASFAPYKDNSLLLVTYDIDRNLILYEVKINWNYPYKTDEPPPQGFRLEPTVVAQRLKVYHRFTLQQLDQQNPCQVNMTHLLLLPASGPPVTTQNLPHIVVAVFSVCDTSPHIPFALRSRRSRAVVMTLSDEQDRTHSSFDQLASRKNRQAVDHASRIISLSRAPDMDISGVIMSVEPLRANTVVAFTKSDGTVEMRDRATMQQAPPHGPSPTYVSWLQETGWSFPSTESKVNFAFSPNCVMTLSKGLDDKLGLNYLEHQPVEGPDVEHQASAFVAAMAMAFANSCFSQNSNNDDIISVLRRNIGTLGPERTLEAAFHALAINPECVVDDVKCQRAQRLVFHPLAVRCISFQQALLRSVDDCRVAMRVAGVIIDLRSICFNLHTALGEAVVHDRTNGVSMPPSLLGIAQYYMSLSAFFIHSLLTSQRALRATSADVTYAQLDAHIRATHNPTVALLLCSAPRAFLRMAARLLKTMTLGMPGWLAGLPMEVRVAWQRLARAIKGAPIDVQRLDLLFDEINHYAKEAYEGRRVGEAERGAAERRYLITGEMPELLLPVAQRLLTVSVNKLVDDVGLSPMRLFDMDFSGLALSDDDLPAAPTDGPGGADPSARPVARRDILRKIDIAPGVKRARRCTRCHGIMEDLTEIKKISYWIIKLGQGCICGNRWVVDDI